MSSPYERVVIRYKDGRMVKCEIQRHFSFTMTSFKAITREGRVQDVKVDDLKAVFFVHDLEGLTYVDSKTFQPNDPRLAGKRIEVTFEDGEILRGRMLSGADEKALGFFVEPADFKANNRRVFVVGSAIKSRRFLDEEQPE